MADTVEKSALTTDEATVTLTLADFQKIIDKQTQTISREICSMREEVTNLVSTMQSIAVGVNELKRRAISLESTCEELVEKQDDVEDAIEDLQDKLKKLEERYETELDKVEAISRRDNLRLFGIPETVNETYGSCAEKVVEILQGSIPGKQWTTDDVIRAHRVGKKPATFAAAAASAGTGGNRPRPRPMIVKLARWQDKMNVLTKGRSAL